ncbi:hypothetical protein Tco_1248332 [Tanacetum coccineum]
MSYNVNSNDQFNRPIFQDPPSPDYVPGPEEPEQAPPSPIYVPFVPEPVYPEFLPEDDVLPAEEQPLPVAASPTTEGGGALSSCRPAGGAVVIQLTGPITLAYQRQTARMSIRPQAPTPFLSEEVAKRLLALPTQPPLPLSLYSPLPQIPSPPLPIPSPPPNSPTYMREICLPLRKRPCRTTLGPGYEVGESLAAGTARPVGPATARADLY